MGNRATVIFTDKENKVFSPAVYLHWNGGAESVYAFLDELDRREIRADQDYEVARFCQIVGEFFDQEYYCATSLGVSNGPANLTADELHRLDPGDNGIFVVCRQTKPRQVRRLFVPYDYEKHCAKGGVQELAGEKVERERKAAYKHKYHKEDHIANTWRELHKDKLTETEHFRQKKQAS